MASLRVIRRPRAPRRAHQGIGGDHPTVPGARKQKAQLGLKYQVCRENSANLWGPHGVSPREPISMTVYLINPSHVSFGIGVITPRWLYVLGSATPETYGEPRLIDETL